MDDITPQNTPIEKMSPITVLKHNPLLIFALVLVVLFFVILFTAISGRQTSSVTPTTTPEAQSSPTTLPSQPEQEAFKKRTSIITYQQQVPWAPIRFSNLDTGDIPMTKVSQADGSIKYTYPSSRADRPNEMIVKSDVIMYSRTAVSQKYIYNYTNDFGAPDYSFQGSQYYGPNSMTYLYLDKGVAFVGDSTTTQVTELLTFRPMSLEEFKKTYGNDITNYTIIPTLAHE